MKLYQCDYEGCEVRAAHMERIQALDKEELLLFSLPGIGNIVAFIALAYSSLDGRYLCKDHFSKLWRKP